VYIYTILLYFIITGHLDKSVQLVINVIIITFTWVSFVSALLTSKRILLKLKRSLKSFWQIDLIFGARCCGQAPKILLESRKLNVGLPTENKKFIYYIKLLNKKRIRFRGPGWSLDPIPVRGTCNDK
jgi:hypothetical protein